VKNHSITLLKPPSRFELPFNPRWNAHPVRHLFHCRVPPARNRFRVTAHRTAA